MLWFSIKHNQNNWVTVVEEIKMQVEKFKLNEGNHCFPAIMIWNGSEVPQGNVRHSLGTADSESMVSSYIHQGKLRIPVSQWQVNKSSDMYQDPSRCCQGSQRMLLREMMWGNWIGYTGKSTHFKSLSLPMYLCSQAHSWAYGPFIWCYHTLELNASWVELHSLHRKTWWGTPLYTPKMQAHYISKMWRCWAVLYRAV